MFYVHLFICSFLQFQTILPESLADLVFPDAEDWPPCIVSLFSHHNNYTLVLTLGDGTRKYAYCRRLQPEGAPICLPLAYVLITPHKDNIFYYKVCDTYIFNYFVQCVV